MKKAVEGKRSSTTGWSKLIAKPNIFDYKSQELCYSERIFEKYLSAVDEGYVKELKEIHEKQNDKFDKDLANEAENPRCIKL